MTPPCGMGLLKPLALIVFYGSFLMVLAIVLWVRHKVNHR